MQRDCQLKSGGIGMYDSKLFFIQYDNEDIDRMELESLDQLDLTGGRKVKWLEVLSLNDETLIKGVGERFNLHPLVVEDILTTNHMPKLEEHDDYLFLILNGMSLSKNNQLEVKQFSFILYEDTVLSFQPVETSIFDEVIAKLKDGTRIRKNQADDLLYTLTDTVIESYFPLIEALGEKIDELEDAVLEDPTKDILTAIHHLKKELIHIRKTLWPMRNAVSSLSKNDYAWIDEKTLYYFRDVYDDIVQLIDLTETYREICSGILDTYLSSIGNKTNDIMKVLTIYSAIFIPLSFLAGIYGMNFTHFPELNWTYGYTGFWVVSIIITGLMLLFFKKKKWF
ncbi:magnesium/cobalt transporter CorA [Alkalibacterium sp. MB6]|uniref:magnesium/cobalt transporter CorA n=1 Tax=Alkalibacterium sp. MB6 TaxID=2081965 RepID=UPI00137B7DC8|nr:magnesium/cobalt transporter CorA [Alkalibacterium sp. MB6]